MWLRRRQRVSSTSLSLTVTHLPGLVEQQPCKSLIVRLRDSTCLGSGQARVLLARQVLNLLFKKDWSVTDVGGLTSLSLNWLNDALSHSRCGWWRLIVCLNFFTVTSLWSNRLRHSCPIVCVNLVLLWQQGSSSSESRVWVQIKCLSMRHLKTLALEY